MKTQSNSFLSQPLNHYYRVLTSGDVFFINVVILIFRWVATIYKAYYIGDKDNPQLSVVIDSLELEYFRDKDDPQLSMVIDSLELE